jgi:hypothetical protein
MALVKNTQHTRTITDRQDAGSHDTFNSYLCDIRSYNLLTYADASPNRGINESMCIEFARAYTRVGNGSS